MLSLHLRISSTSLPSAIFPALNTYSNPSRDKIIIRPRCKTYAQKQRAIGCTLACFTAISLNNESSTDTSGTTTPSPPPPTENSTERPAKVVRFFKLGSEPATAKVHSGRIEKTLAKSSVANVLTQSQISHPVAINNIYSGCGEITATATPAVTAVASIGNPPYLHPSFELPSTQHPCTCCDPKCCPRCRLLALADRYVNQNHPDAPADNTFPSVSVPS